VVLFTSHDHQFISTIANRVIELHPHGFIDRLGNFEDYLEDPGVAAQREKLWQGQAGRLSL
jgi:ATPase subunit of ABC transporter with duplicated ATPase domains